MVNKYENACRTCLQEDSDAVSINDYTVFSNPKITYAEILKDIARLEFNDVGLELSHMPQQLCFICCRQLRKAYTFVRQARESEEKLKKIVDTIHDELPIVLNDFELKDNHSAFKLEIIDEIEIGEKSLNNIDTDRSQEHEDTIKNLEYVNISLNPSYFYDISNISQNQNFSLENEDYKNELTKVLENSSSVQNCNSNNKLLNEEENTIKNNDEEFINLNTQDVTENSSKDIKDLPYKCELCPCQYNNQYNLKFHLFYSHQIGPKHTTKKSKKIKKSKSTTEPDYACDSCDFTTKSPAALRCHIRRKHASQEDKSTTKIRHLCTVCDYSANSQAALYYHTQSKHGSENDKITCKFCSFSHFKKFSLFAHMKNAHLSKIKSLKKMKLRGKRFSNNLDNEDDPIDCDTEHYSSECSSADEDIIRDILNIRKRLPKTTNEIESNLDLNLIDFNCTICLKSFSTQESLLEHMNDQHSTENLSEDQQKPYACDKCSQSFNELKNLKMHLINIHKSDWKEHRKKYKKISEENKFYKCQLCEYRGNSAAAIHFHVRSKHGTEEDKIKCFFCEYTNYKKFSLLKHLKGSHLPMIRLLKKEMNASTVSIENILKIVPQIKNTNEYEKEETKKTNNNLNPCSTDDEDFIRDILKMQKRGSKLNIAKTFAIRCDECGNVYKDSQALNVHKRNVHGIHNYKPCNQCHRKYKRSYDLKLHILHCHTPNKNKNFNAKQPPKEREKRFMCTECSYVCTTSTLLTIHTSRHHTGERPHKCNVCSKSFVVAFDLKTHSYLHTGERPFKCSVCSKGFRDKSHMLKHQRIHSDEKPYNCNECGKGFTKNYNLTIHKRTHMKGQNLNCAVCGKFFKDRAQLNIHQINELHYGEAT